MSGKFSVSVCQNVPAIVKEKNWAYWFDSHTSHLITFKFCDPINTLNWGCDTIWYDMIGCDMGFFDLPGGDIPGATEIPVQVPKTHFIQIETNININNINII